MLRHKTGRGKGESPLVTETSPNRQNIKVLLAKLGLDGHDRGIKVIARAMRDAGMEVVYMGMRVTPDQVAQTALQEDVDVVGISILSGAHMRLMPRLTKALQERGISDDLLLMVGGTIPEDDLEPLRELGVQGVFPVGSFTSAMTEFITENVVRGRSAPQI